MKLSDLGDPRRGDAAVPCSVPAELIALGGPTVVVLGVRRGDLAAKRFLLQLAEAGVGRSVPVVISSLRRASGPLTLDAPARGEHYVAAGALSYRGASVPAEADVIDAQLRAWAEDAPPGALHLALGADFAARARADVVVALTGGLPPLAFSPAARAVAERFGLQLAEPRAEVARGLVARLLTAC
ncbi:MAG: hypothetical protein R3B40_02550 [Polyangiales bacterium]